MLKKFILAIFVGIALGASILMLRVVLKFSIVYMQPEVVSYWVDPDTHCQYLVRPGVMTPRSAGPDQKQVCRELPGVSNGGS